MQAISRRPMLVVFSSPSGAGKTSITRRILGLDPLTRLSVSWTTRAPRPGEIDGQDYVFVDDARFEAETRGRGFLEHALVFGAHYGSPRAYVEDALAEGHDVLFDIDWQGAQQLVRHARQDVVTIFILPPSMAALEERLRKRAQDDDAVVARRMAKAAAEIAHWQEYDYVIVNDFFERALQECREIIAAERLRRTRRPGLLPFVEGLIGRP